MNESRLPKQFSVSFSFHRVILVLCCYIPYLLTLLINHILLVLSCCISSSFHELIIFIWCRIYSIHFSFSWRTLLEDREDEVSPVSFFALIISLLLFIIRIAWLPVEELPSIVLSRTTFPNFRKVHWDLDLPYINLVVTIVLINDIFIIVFLSLLVCSCLEIK